MITGPTGAGKSDLAVEIAERFGGVVVSMDAMQVYRGMDVGTAKVSPEVRARVPHFLLDVRDPDEDFSAADFVRETEAVVASGRPVVICGGTVFYLRAWVRGLVPAPPVDPALRATLEALDDPHARLREVDPVLAARLHPNDRVRIVRGLEIHALTGRPLSDLHAVAPPRREAEVVWVDRDDLYARVDARVEAMMAAGYLDEVRALLAKGYGRERKPMQSLGYRHLADHLAGEIPLEEAVRRTRRDTRNYARKQRSFLRGLGYAPGGDPWAAAARAFDRA
ncbi:MAG: tRNA (adenosine(37)-N6)-dimethylallyltransferase MiaA [Myxococcota bacterium]